MGISYLRVRYSTPLHVVLGLLLVGLALICINVLSLQIARANERQRELAIRRAIGGSKIRILRQHLVEALLFAGLSGLLGLSSFRPITGAITGLMTTWNGRPAEMNLRLNAELFLLTVCLCLTIALITGLIPAFYSSSRDIHGQLQKRSTLLTSGNRRRIVNSIGATQLAVSLVMITGACLFGLSLHRLRQFDSGIKRERLVEVETSESGDTGKPERAILQENALRERLLSVPGVEGATFSQNGIYSGRNYSGTFQADGFHPADEHARYGIYDYVGPKFFTTLGTRFLEGRDFDERDNATGLKVVIINQTLARRVSPNGDFLGRNLYVQEENVIEAYRVIGIVRNVKTDLRSAEMTWYFPALQHPVHAFGSRFLVRLKASATSIVSLLGSAARSIDPQARIASIDAADTLLNRTLDTDRLLARIGLGFGALALLLASAGIYGLLSYEVVKRTPEFGIRSALGALRIDIIRLVISQLVVLLSIGLLVGSAGAVMLARFVQALVFGIKADDYRIEITAALTLTCVASVAAAMPAFRAASVDPMKALRAE